MLHKASHGFKNLSPRAKAKAADEKDKKAVSNLVTLLQAKQRTLSTFVDRFKAKAKDAEEKKQMSWLSRTKSNNKTVSNA